MDSILNCLGALLLAFTLTSCQSLLIHRDNTQFLPRLDGNNTIIVETPLADLRRLQLVATNLVSALLQIPDLNAGAITVQVSRPNTAFGNIVVRAFEDAGFGIQRVSADQGINYVTYAERRAETESGSVTDFSIAVGEIQVRREFKTAGSKIFPASLLLISGTDNSGNIELGDHIFAEQGGAGVTFLSGVGGQSIDAVSADVQAITVQDYDAAPLGQRSAQNHILNTARAHSVTNSSAKSTVDITDYIRVQRTVLIFHDNNSIVMGRSNKQAIRLLASEYRGGDMYSITPCADADGKNEDSRLRGIRIKEEFISHGINVDDVKIQPCMRASYRHSSDEAPVAVTVVQYRNR